MAVVVIAAAAARGPRGVASRGSQDPRGSPGTCMRGGLVEPLEHSPKLAPARGVLAILVQRRDAIKATGAWRFALHHGSQRGHHGSQRPIGWSCEGAETKVL